MKDIPAFPTAQYADGVRPSGFDNGMTLRDYFAARVLPMAIKEANEAESFQIDDAAIVAYQYADSMMRVRGL
jgi:hypothetical protein